MSINELDLDCLYLADSNKKKSHLETRNFQMRFLFWPNMATNGPRAHPQQETHGTGRLAAPAFIKTQAGSPSISIPHISQH